MSFVVTAKELINIINKFKDDQIVMRSVDGDPDNTNYWFTAIADDELETLRCSKGEQQ